MKSEEILKDLEQIFKKVLKKNTLNINEEDQLSNIKGWDSLLHINIIEDIEAKFNIDFSAGEVVVLKTVADLVQLIQSKL